ncbi:MAG: 30S ribosomal protein S17 [Chlamydiae bacterium]|nr:30S ribosomal protein S17 [Chlamydiota bacterium]
MSDLEIIDARKTHRGTVISDKMDKTVTVSVERTCRDNVYGKVIKKRKKYYAHDESESAKIGDTVLIMGTRPLSKLKRWRVVEVLKS